MTDARTIRTHARADGHEHGHDEHAANSLGMWLFLASEVMFFGVLFTGYVVYRQAYPLAFAEGSRHLDLVLGTINTFILLTSSLTMALAVHSIQVGNRKLLMVFLLVTMLLATVFLGFKGLEYVHKFEEGLFPGQSFAFTGPEAQPQRMFYSLYFVMTGLHAIHIIIGILLMAVMLWRGWRKHFSPEKYAPVEMTGLYWHFVDLVWIFLFPLLYLIDRT